MTDSGSYGGAMDMGTDGDASWLQSTDRNNLATVNPLLLNPNGGNVGIGTMSPVSKLDVNGGFSVGITEFYKRLATAYSPASEPE